MWLGTLGASLLRNMWAGIGIVRTGSGNKKGKRILRAGYGNKKGKRVVRVVTEMKWIFNAASSFKRLGNTKVLLK